MRKGRSTSPSWSALAGTRTRAGATSANCSFATSPSCRARSSRRWTTRSRSRCFRSGRRRCGSTSSARSPSGSGGSMNPPPERLLGIRVLIVGAKARSPLTRRLSLLRHPADLTVTGEALEDLPLGHPIVARHEPTDGLEELGRHVHPSPGVRLGDAGQIRAKDLGVEDARRVDPGGHRAALGQVPDLHRLAMLSPEKSGPLQSKQVA